MNVMNVNLLEQAVFFGYWFIKQWKGFIHLVLAVVVDPVHAGGQVCQVKPWQEGCYQVVLVLSPCAVGVTWLVKNLCGHGEQPLQQVLRSRVPIASKHLFLCAPFLSEKEIVHFFLRSLPCFDKCHKTSLIFTSAEQTSASAWSALARKS